MGAQGGSILERFLIQEMEIKDLDHVLQIEWSSSLTPWSKGMFMEEMLNPYAHCFVIKLTGNLDIGAVGFICFRNIENESELFNLCVHPRYQLLGLGKKLMQFYIDSCSAMGIRTFYLDVSLSNGPAIHLYQLFLYQPIGVRPKFYQGKWDALTMMRKV